MIGDPIGFLNIHKPLGLTSHDLVDQARRAARTAGYHTLKVGHAGTLDPLATGVLILCIGAATRLSEYVMGADKRYLARVHLGRVTDTYDGEGQIIAENDASHITHEDIQRVLPQFTGDIQQIPPMHSAIKQDGRKLYELARKGTVVERPPRAVTIHALTIARYEPPFVTLDVTCSSGTYIRSLAFDLGEALGVGGTLNALTRTTSGAFTLEDAKIPDQAFAGDWLWNLTTPMQALTGWHTLTLDADGLEALSHGRSILRDPALPEQQALAVDSRGELIAIVRGVGELWKPDKVFLP